MAFQIAIVLVGLGAVAVGLAYAFVRANTVICEPNEVVVISGRQRPRPDGGSVGYRVIRGGRGFRWPIFETVARMSLTNIPVEISVRKALTAGVVPIHIDGRANVKLAASPPLLDAAIERFLGRKLDDAGRVAREAIEGSLRGIIAQCTPEEANARRLEVERQVAEQARADLEKLGLVLDFFKVQNISDDQGYLDAIARRRNAEVQRDAKIAEATAEADARAVTADQRRRGRVAETDAEMVVTDRENALAIHKARLEVEASREQQRAALAGPIARVAEEHQLEERRVARNRQRQIADVVVPAEAGELAAIARARGEAAAIVEDGRATAEAVRMMQEHWRDGTTKDLFLIRMLPELTDKVTSVVRDNLRIDKLVVMDGGADKGVPQVVRNLTQSAVAMMEQLHGATGVDVAGVLNGKPKERQIPPELGV